MEDRLDKLRSKKQVKTDLGGWFDEAGEYHSNEVKPIATDKYVIENPYVAQQHKKFRADRNRKDEEAGGECIPTKKWDGKRENL